MALAQHSQQFGTIRARAGHGQVGEYGMAGLLYQQLQQSSTVGSGTGHVHLVTLEHDSDAVQDDRMVVGNDDARLHGELLGNRTAHQGGQ
ncbi:hypothetical protein D3C72_1636910 [compost metagenome]